MSVTKLLKTCDIYGYTVKLTYDKDNIRHRSVYGGIVTILISLVIIYQIVESLTKINNPTFSTNVESTAFLDLSSVGEFPMEDTQ